jgi:hypothetical protein
MYDVQLDLFRQFKWKTFCSTAIKSWNVQLGFSLTRSCNFSEALAPFKHLLKEGQQFEWIDDLQATFKAATRHLTLTKYWRFRDQTGRHDS